MPTLGPSRAQGDAPGTLAQVLTSETVSRPTRSKQTQTGQELPLAPRDPSAPRPPTLRPACQEQEGERPAGPVARMGLVDSWTPMALCP